MKVFRIADDNDKSNNSEDMDDVTGEKKENKDRQGMIRTVPNAHLVYKRKRPDGKFKELWMYKITDIRKSMKIRHAILAGTDIPNDKTSSPEGEQWYELWSIGDIEMMDINGLPN